MSLVQFASLWNLTAVGIVLGLSLLLRRRIPAAPHFETWCRSYACVFASIACELLASLVGRSWLLNAAEVAIVGVNITLLMQMVSQLPLPVVVSRAVLGLPGVAVLGSLGAMALGQPFPVAAAPMMLGLSASAVWVGCTLTRQPRHLGQGSLRWVGWPLIAAGLLPLAFPVIGDTGGAWLGYWAGGVLHLVVGIGMGLATLERFEAELQATTEELRAQQAKLRELDRLKSAFVGSVSHELRTPQAAIKAAAWLGLQDAQAGKQVLGETIVAQTDVLARLVGDLLIYSRIESGEMTHDRDPVDVRQLAEEVLDGLEPLYQQKGLALVRRLPEGPLPALLDAPQIAQVLRNLLVNAHSFTPVGGRVEARLDEVEDHVRLVVADTGVGIPPVHHAAIFERFHQVDGTTSRRVGGTGLGLAICQARRHHRGRERRRGGQHLHRAAPLGAGCPAPPPLAPA
ncbi:MAG: ATP-binding protein [Candidatus Sericytochromatia bacterium]|nr:ATP-binding protein [Candidatus Sericytochromatia bacterium]MEB3221374.1 ATP-binding protein [Candidatus Sericytochromatia bacterium]